MICFTESSHRVQLNHALDSLTVELYDRDYWLYGKVKLVTICQLAWHAYMNFSITVNMVQQFKQEQEFLGSFFNVGTGIKKSPIN